jgi:hypothetical protein
LVPALGAETWLTLIGERPSPGIVRDIVRQLATAFWKDRCSAATAVVEPIQSRLSSMNGPCAPAEYDRAADDLEPGGLSAFVSATRRAQRESFDETLTAGPSSPVSLSIENPAGRSASTRRALVSSAAVRTVLGAGVDGATVGVAAGVAEVVAASVGVVLVVLVVTELLADGAADP